MIDQQICDWLDINGENYLDGRCTYKRCSVSLDGEIYYLHYICDLVFGVAMVQPLEKSFIISEMCFDYKR